MVVTSPMLIVTRKSLPANDLSGLVSWLKANPNKASQGTSGVGYGQLFGTFFQAATGTQFQIVPYRGNGPAMQDLVAGQIDLMFDPPATSLPQVEAGTIRALAVTANTRLSGAPKIPTVDEAGLPKFYLSIWYGLWAPKGTAKEIIAKLNAASVEALADPGVRRKIADLALEIPSPEQQTPQALGALQKAEIEKWWPIIKAANIKPE